jgi:hypothetical protein
MPINQYTVTFPNIGFVGATVSDEELSPILSEIAKIATNFKNSKKSITDFKLEHEYCLVETLTHTALLEILTPLTEVFNQSYNYKPEVSKFKISNAWVNFQKKHEFARPHSHIGDFSFVIWIKVPFSIKDETENNNVEAACFSFQYTNTLGKIQNWTIPVDNTYEKRVILFPSDMIHLVYPFYSSDEYRIAVAGNIVADI